MPEELLVETYHNVRRHPWWAARARLAISLLHHYGVLPPASVIDAGCGWGVNLEALEKAGYHVTGLDISYRILQLIDRPDRRLVEADLMQDLPVGFQSVDAVLALDVIEHLEDDRQALSRLGSMVRAGGYVIVSVPALPELWSAYDEIQGHKRRYLPATLREAFLGTNLELRDLLWWGAWMVPVLKAIRLGFGVSSSSSSSSSSQLYVKHLKVPPWPATFLLKQAFAWEHGRALAGKLKIGTSLFAISVRRN